MCVSKYRVCNSHNFKRMYLLLLPVIIFVPKLDSSFHLLPNSKHGKCSNREGTCKLRQAEKFSSNRLFSECTKHLPQGGSTRKKLFVFLYCTTIYYDRYVEFTTLEGINWYEFQEITKNVVQICRRLSIPFFKQITVGSF